MSSLLMVISQFSVAKETSSESPSCAFDVFVPISASCPLEGSGKVTHIVDSRTMWVMPNDKNADFNMSRATNNTFKNQSRDRSKGIKLNILGVSNTIAKLDTSSVMNIENDAVDFLSESILGKNVSYACYFLDDKINLLCSVDFKGNDLGQIFIKKGLSKYVVKYGRHPKRDKEYEQAELEAKGSEIGIWKPFFGMFIFKKK